MNEGVLGRRLRRERQARREAEQLLEQKSQDLYLANQELRKTADWLENKVEERTTELVKARDQAMEASQGKSRFIAVMSHGVRSPLNGIIGAINLLEDSNIDAEQGVLVHIAHESANSLLALVNDILEFSKIETDKFRLEKSLVSLQDVVEATIEKTRLVAEQKNIGLTYSLSGQLPEYLYMDRNRVSQVLTNLVDNAIKFTENGGVHIDVSKQHHVDQVSCIRFEVCDTGLGIAEEDKDRIFEEFWSQSPKEMKNIVGTGLGLSICRKLTDRMNGEIGFESTLNRGSRFWFQLPMERPKGIRRIDSKSSPKEKNSSNGQLVGNALVVDDDNINRMIVSAMLRKLGLGVVAKENALSCFDFLKSNAADVVLMDIDMPIMDGVEALKVLRNSTDQKIRRLPVIALTAHAMQGDRERFLGEGFDDYLVKPISGEQLYEGLVKHLGQDD